jgi:glycosyltransferase involved in cell wall biosynthesis
MPLSPSKKLKILCLSVYPTLGPSIRYRISIYKKHWENEGVSLTIKAFMTHRFFLKRREFGFISTLYKVSSLIFCTLRLILRLTTLWRYDVIIIHREVFPLGDAFFETMVSKLNQNVIFDLDDALWAPISLKINQRKHFWSGSRFSNTMKNCRSVVAGNNYLANYCQQFNSDVTIIPTPSPDLEGRAIDQQHINTPPIIVWIGNTGNEDYLDIIKAPLQQLAKKHSFILRIIGGSDICNYKIPGVTIEALAWNQELEQEWICSSNIGVMPLFDQEYEKGKCSFKLIQYFSAGLPVVASPVGMNCDVVTQKKNGYLAKEPNDWVIALEQLLLSSDKRKRMGKFGYLTWQEKFTSELNAQLWLKVLRNNK